MTPFGPSSRSSGGLGVSPLRPASELRRVIPTGVAVVDFFRHDRFTYDKKISGIESAANPPTGISRLW